MSDLSPDVDASWDKSDDTPKSADEAPASHVDDGSTDGVSLDQSANAPAAREQEEEEEDLAPPTTTSSRPPTSSPTPTATRRSSRRWPSPRTPTSR